VSAGGKIPSEEEFNLGDALVPWCPDIHLLIS